MLILTYCLVQQLKVMFLYLTKIAFLQDEKFSKEEGTLFLLKVIFTIMCLTKFSPKISPELLQTTLNFILHIFSFVTLSQKSRLWFPTSTVKYISQECHNCNFSYLHMELESGLIFKNVIILANLNLHLSFLILNS